MGRKLRMTISEDQAGRTAGWVMEHCFHMSRRERGRAKFQEDGILVNGARCRVTQVLAKGDCLEVSGEKPDRTSYEEDCRSVFTYIKPEICYEDQDVLVVNKPAGVLMHPVGCHQGDTLADQVREYLGRQGIPQIPRSIGRLDKETSGAVVFAKNQMAAARLQRQRQQGIFRKEYLALAEGIFKEKRQTVRLAMSNAAKEGMRERMKISSQGMEAVTHYEVLGDGRDCSLLHLWLETGRTHQIRVHMAALGHPLLGDTIYGREEPAAPYRAALHAAQVTFLKPFGNDKLSFYIPLPEDLRQVLRSSVKEIQYETRSKTNEPGGYAGADQKDDALQNLFY